MLLVKNRALETVTRQGYAEQCVWVLIEGSALKVCHLHDRDHRAPPQVIDCEALKISDAQVQLLSAEERECLLLRINENLMPVRRIAPGEYFGVNSAMHQSERQTSVVAITDCVWAAIECPIFMRYVGQYYEASPTIASMKKSCLFK